MNKRAPKTISILLALLAFTGLLRATLPQVLIGNWAPAASLSQARSAASAVVLSDGRVLITGGDGANGPLQTAEFFGTDGTVSPAAAMNAPRSGHFAVALSDGRVLVGGGTTSGGGNANSAEIYDPSADSWTLTNPLTTARTGATAALLQDGRVIVAGGVGSGTPNDTIEIYDPATDNFSFAGTLSSPRSKQAMAVLSDGRVLIVGGFDGTNALSSSDIFDPTAGNIVAGPTLSTARYRHSATTLLDGRVLVAGGVTDSGNGLIELASAEMFDPSTGLFSTISANLASSRQGHQAFLLPNNNNVLIVGGTSGGQPVAIAELFSPWQQRFTVMGSNVVARGNTTASPMRQDGIFLAAGGSDASGNPLASTELYGFSTVKTDQSDYAPGSIVTITGSGWQPGETVTLTLVESPLIDTHPPMTTVADANGNIFNNQFSPDVHDLNIRFSLTAVGSQSGLQAQNMFSDSQPGSVTLNPASATVVAGSSAVYSTSVVMGGNGTNCTVTLSVSPSPVTTGASPSFSGGANPFTTNADFSRSLTITTTNTGTPGGRTQPGTYPFTVSASKGANCQGNGSVTTSGTLIVAGPATTLAVTGFPSPVAAGSSQSFTVRALDGNGNTAIGYTGTIHFTSSDTQALLPANYTFVAGDNGVHIFNGALGTAGTQSITAMDTVGNTITGTQSGIIVNAGPTAQLLVAGHPSPVLAGTSNSFTVTAEDAFGNLTSGYTGTVHFTSSDAAAILPANHTFTTGSGNKDNGAATFNATFNSAGTQSITATDIVSASITGTQLGITVNSATANTTITLASSSNPSTYGSAVTFTATVTRASGTNTPTQTVVIKEGSITICTTGNLSGSGGTATGSCTISNLSVIGSPHALTAVYGGDSNFNGSTSAVLSQIVNPKALTVVGISAQDKIYDATTSATLNTASATLAALISGDSVTLNTAGATGTFSDKNFGTTKTVTVAGMTISGTSAGNYTLTQPTTTADITAKALTVTSLTASNKSYDGTTSATLTGTATLQSPETPGVGTTSDGKPYSGDAVVLSGTPVGTFASKDVANAISVSASGLSLGGANAGNYSLTALALSANIAPATVSASIIGNPAKTYDGSTSASLTPPNFSLSGLASGENFTVTQTSGTYNTPNVATAVTVSVSLSAVDFTPSPGTLASNYTLPTSASGPGHIDRASATISVTPYSVTYSGAAHTAAGTAKGVLNDNLAGLDLSGTTHTSAGDYPADPWTFTDVTGNYNNANATVHDHIDRADPVVSVTPYSLPYSGAAHTATGTAKGVLNETLVGLDLSGTTHTNAGDYSIDPWTFTDVTGNYNNASGTVHDHIDKANAVVSVTPYSLTYSGAAHTASGTAKGVLNESLGGLDLSGTTHTNAGDYPADPWTFTDVTGNYNNATGTVHDHIDKANAVISVTPYSVTYSGVAHTATGTAKGVLNENLGGLDLSGTSHTDAGDYVSDAWTFTDPNGNYNNANGTVHDHIDKANAVVSVTPYSVTYSGAAHTATGTAKGVLNEILAGLDLSGTTQTNAGDYPADPWTFTDATGNYNNATGTVHDHIDKANAVISVTPYTATYSGAAHTATATAKGVLNENLGGLDLSATTHTDAGDYPSDAWTFIDVTGNYNSTGGTVHDHINKANATINVTPYNVVYDGNPHTATGTAKGVLNESLAGLGLSGTTHINAGDYPSDAWTFTDVTGNYNSTGGTVHDHINKANATIDVTPYNVVYDGNPHTATGTATGVKGESLSGLNLTGTTHSNPGDYTFDPWSFTDVSGNYNGASGTVHDQIRFGVCSSAFGIGNAILPPINSDGSSVYPRKGGSTIPVKFRVCGAAGTPIASANLVFAPTGATLTMLSAVRGTIDNVNESGIIDVPDVAFRWDSSGQQWIFNMGTSNLTAGQTYQFRVNLAYGPQSIPFVVGVK
jgi:hypothetical protein